MINRLLLIALCFGAAGGCQRTQLKVGCPTGQVSEAGQCVDPPGACTAGQALYEQCANDNRQCVTGGLTGNRCGKCNPGFTDEGGICRPVRDCTALGCTSINRTCVAASDNADARCTRCVDGADDRDGKCIMPTCAAAPVPGSIREQCSAAHTKCTEVAGQAATCGECVAGFVKKFGECVAVTSCAQLGCSSANRLCVPQGDTTDASCGTCRGGFNDVNGVCVKSSTATCSAGADSIASTCATENRGCGPSTPAGAECTSCNAGYVENTATHLCETQQTCGTLACGTSQHRECEALPNAHCTACQAGFTEDPQTGACRPVVTCSQLTCTGDDQCFEAGANSDAFCRTGCPQNTLFNGTRCEPCPPCNDAGETGRSSTPSAAGACICTTAPGYFYSLAADVGTFACDADGDGWVRESARNSIESADPLLRANAHCDLRKIDRFELVNEAGESSVKTLGAPLALYESDRNDDDVVLRTLWTLRNLPEYGAGHFISAAEMNRLTKWCHHPRTDYNDNSVPDIEEFADRDLAPGFRADQRPFNLYSYFAELHTGRYEAPASSETYGRFVIKEKSRLDDPLVPAADKVSIEYAPADATHWRECSVLRDSQATTQSPPIGMDFAKADLPVVSSFNGMHHHSQFKCLLIDAQPTPSKPYAKTQADIIAADYRMNECVYGGAPTSQAGVNPKLPVSDCTYVSASTADPGDVMWAAVPYYDYGPGLTRTDYVRGCVNDCIVQLPLCPFYSVNPAGVTCDHDESNFGKHLSCDAFEVCDGLDNDGTGGADDGDPGGGFVCPTGEAGRCAIGTTHCRAPGEIKCERNLDPIPETCNGEDDDCANGADDGNPGSNVTCPVSGLLGACASGKTTCVSGAIECHQTVFPVAEICNNSVDDNCDGGENEGEDKAGCTDYYYDFDNDGWGVTGNKKCLCAANATTKYTARAKNFTGSVGVQPYAFDCCDTDNSAYPNNQTLRSAVTACSVWDGNCNGLSDVEYGTATDGGCGQCCSEFCCCDGSAGWANRVANCGETYTWYTGSCSSWASCSRNSSSVFQRCK